MPFFCAVPIGTPVDSGRATARSLPRGPITSTSYTPKQQIVLRRNPNYRGPRPHRLDQIVYTLGIAKARTVVQIEAGEADYAPDGVPPGRGAQLAARYGAGSQAARAGRQRYFAGPLLGVAFLALNTSRPLFADVNMRKAANYAIDRPALAREQQGPFSGSASQPTSIFRRGSPASKTSASTRSTGRTSRLRSALQPAEAAAPSSTAATPRHARSKLRS